ncbi:hypothetical protein I5Q34_01165 [Streptomyces sp. AV19]|uniref:DUF6415 family natural product biosynthesis protein n=1 Tax=Streptomyces sp. AV19 TaxID=2793068 RepID=UPI0018FEF8D6|nr:DUF6415 family natural product biosynthesis protein [Streptomyces sp. AV19]MBH1932914.1 hypothetical protein [Streptomyces sp. AV19]MDG4531592.1 DUF6415 family natural product biosynthesis protein [Streptomyces sp. AV19]
MITARRLDHAQIRDDLREAVNAYVLISPARETGRVIARLTRHLTALLRMTERQAAACPRGSVPFVMRQASADRAREALAKHSGRGPRSAADHALALYCAVIELLDYLPEES